MDLLRTSLALVTIPSTTVACGSAAIAGGLFGARKLPEQATQLWVGSVLASTGTRLLTTGQERAEPGRTYILVSNHQSHMDVPSIVKAWDGPVRFVAKKELFRIPIFGHAMNALGHVPVDRRNRDQARESLEAVADRVRNEVSILFFAEGTRSADGALGRFKKGALMMAEVTGVPIVPVGVAGTRDVLPKGSLGFSPGTAAVAFGAPLSGLDDVSVPRDERLARLRAAVMEQMAEAQRLLDSDGDAEPSPGDDPEAGGAAPADAA